MSQMIDCQNNGDTEIAHSKADNLLCEFLYELGHGDLIKEYRKVSKWYA